MTSSTLDSHVCSLWEIKAHNAKQKPLTSSEITICWLLRVDLYHTYGSSTVISRHVYYTRENGVHTYLPDFVLQYITGNDVWTILGVSQLHSAFD
jgi:hypothetical protein